MEVKPQILFSHVRVKPLLLIWFDDLIQFCWLVQVLVVDETSGQEEDMVVGLEINGQDRRQTLYLMEERGLGRRESYHFDSLVCPWKSFNYYHILDHCFFSLLEVLSCREHTYIYIITS